MMLNASSSHHTARRDDDAGEFAVIDLLGILRGLGKGKTLPLKWRSILCHELPGSIAVFFGVLQENFDGLNRHRTVAKDRNFRRLSGLHQFLKHENEFLCTLDGKSRDNHCAAPLPSFTNQIRQLRPRVILRMLAISVSRLHDYDLGRFPSLRPRINYLARRYVLVVHATDIAGEQ